MNKEYVMARKASHLTFEERKYIGMLYDEGLSPYKIGKILGRASNTIRNELKRGTTTVIINYFEREKYFPDTGQAIYEKNRQRCRMPRKIDYCSEFITYVEERVKKGKRSFASARAEAVKSGLFPEREICSIGTLYSYVEKDMLAIKNVDLPEKVGRRPRRKQLKRTYKRLKGKSISERPDNINSKEEFGHWEIDLVIGKKTTEDNVLLTLTERKTKKEIIRKIKGKTISSVHNCIKRLKKEIPYFSKVFRSITSDNGVEFSRLHELGKNLGIDIYYAHPYSSWERGLNENTNRVIRRFIPKGEMIKDYTRNEVKEIETWINSMYRKSLNWRTAEEVYQEELLQVVGEIA